LNNTENNIVVAMAMVTSTRSLIRQVQRQDRLQNVEVRTTAVVDDASAEGNDYPKQDRTISSSTSQE
jgi:hypothetical protein